MSSVKRFLDQIWVYDCGMTKIRIGNSHDGGYVALREICEKTQTVYSFGIGDDVGFELDFADRFPQAQMRLFDPGISAPPENHPSFYFSKQGALEWYEAGYSTRPGSLLKMDIEWAEWVFFLSITDKDLLSFSQILVELHLVHAEPRAGLSPYFQSFYQAALGKINDRLFTMHGNVLAKINQYFYAFHIHANNSLPLISVGGYAFPPLIEMSFVRKDMVGAAQPTAQSFPVAGLDAPNKTDRPDLLNVYPLGGIAWA